MTREQAKEHSAILKAFVDGKTVQWKYGDRWKDYDASQHSNASIFKPITRAEAIAIVGANNIDK